MGSCNADPDPEGGKPAQKRRKIKSEDQKKIIKISIFNAIHHILGKELGLKLFNVRKIRWETHSFC
jgi:hypothetical protein